MIALANVKLFSLFKSVSLAAETASETPTTETQKVDSFPALRMKNSFFRVHFDLDSGRFSIWRNNGSMVLMEMTARASVGKSRRAASEKEYARCVKVTEVENEFGEGRQLAAQCIDSRHELDFEIRIFISDRRETVVVEAFGRNVSKETFAFEQIELVSAASEENPRASHLHRSPELALAVAMEPGKTASSGKMIFDFAAADFGSKMEAA